MSENENKSLLGQNITIVFGLIVVIGMCIFSYSIMSNSGLILVSPEDDYTLSIPEDWEYVDIPTTDVNPIYGTLVANSDGTASAFVLVTPYAEYTQDPEFEVEYISEVYADFGFEFLDQVDTNLNGLDCIEYEATLSDYLGSYHQKGFIGFENDNKYMMIAQASDDIYDEVSPIFDSIIKSFTVS